MSGSSAEVLHRMAGAGLRVVLLPGTFTWARLRIPGIEQLLRKKLLPSDLRAIASKFATSGIDFSDATDEDVDAFLNFTDQMVALSWRDVDARGPAAGPEPPADDSPDWLPVRLNGAELEEYELDVDDLQAIAAIALRRQSSRVVTLLAKREAGYLTDEEQDQLEGSVRDAEEEEPTARSFRGPDREPGGDTPRSDGGAVLDEPEPAPPDGGPGDRVLDRRRARAEAGPRGR